MSAVDRAMTDEALCESARRGSARSVEALVERYQDRIYRFAFRMSHNASDAEEIAQETFLHVATSIAAFHGESRFVTWLYRIAFNAALMRQRAAARRPTRPLDERAVADPSALADDLLDEKETVSRVKAALAALDDDHRAALVLRDLEELSAEDAAEILGVSPAAVRQRAHRARMRMRELLAVPEAPRRAG